jgi:PBP superfamily domain
MPMVAGSLVLAYNLPGLDGPLKLTREVYVDIFLGKIRAWDDLRLQRINPDLKLLRREIALVVRQDGSGTTYAFSNHLSMVLLPTLASAHGPVGEAALASADPQLFIGWQAWVHVLVQWSHLLGLPLWFEALVVAWVFRVLDLEALLFAGWAVMLLQGVTGGYSLEYSAGIPRTPSLLQWSLVAAYDFGQSYTATLGIKQGLYGLAVLIMLLVTALHLHRGRDINRTRLRRFYLAAQIPLGILITLAATGVLLLHEAADVAPTPVHALGGVSGLEGEGVRPAAQDLPEPYRS